MHGGTRVYAALLPCAFPGRKGAPCPFVLAMDAAKLSLSSSLTISPSYPPLPPSLDGHVGIAVRVPPLVLPAGDSLWCSLPGSIRLLPPFPSDYPPPSPTFLPPSSFLPLPPPPSLSPDSGSTATPECTNATTICL